MLRLRRRSFAVSAILLAILAFQASPSANHRWRRFHWARTANPFTVDLGDNLSDLWPTYLMSASTDWTKSDVLNTVVVNGGTSVSQCSPTSGRVEVCNAEYGSTGWLGVAQIWITGGSHIVQGTVKVNDTYFNTAQYNSDAWRQFVMCQEVGHTFGLDHQDENFNNVNLGTCMDYTSDPDGSLQSQSSNLHPNAHDYEELDIIYSHLDSFSTVGAAATATGRMPPLNDPSEWGRLVKVAHGGKTQIFERDFGHGQIVVTFVIWA
jgi:hypothetical protein